MCNDSRIRNADTEDLLEMLEETKDQLQIAKKELFEARANHRHSSIIEEGVQDENEAEILATVSGSRSPGQRRFSQSREIVSLNRDIDVSITRRRRVDTDLSNQAVNSFNGSDPADPFKSIHGSMSVISEASTAVTQYPTSGRLWELANRVVLNSERPWAMGRLRYRRLADGQWSWDAFSCSWKNLFSDAGESVTEDQVQPKTKKYLNSLLEQQKYAVVTFTSRQAGKCKLPNVQRNG
jgi:hypothetical protein